MTSVSNPNVTIDGRALLIPSGFAGTFSDMAGHGTVSGQSTVTVNVGTTLANPTGSNTATAIVPPGRLTIGRNRVAETGPANGRAGLFPWLNRRRSRRADGAIGANFRPAFLAPLSQGSGAFFSHSVSAVL